MRPSSILRRQMIWVLGLLGLGSLVLVLTAYLVTLLEINEVLDDSLRQTALLLADRDLAHAAERVGTGHPALLDAQLDRVDERVTGQLVGVEGQDAAVLLVGGVIAKVEGRIGGVE